MKIRQRKWVKQALVIALMIATNIFGAIFFGLGSLAALFITGYFSIALSKDSFEEIGYLLVMPSSIVFAVTLVIYSYYAPIKIGNMDSDQLKFISGSLLFIFFLGGWFIGYATTKLPCSKEQE